MEKSFQRRVRDIFHFYYRKKLTIERRTSMSVELFAFMAVLVIGKVIQVYAIGLS